MRGASGVLGVLNSAGCWPMAQAAERNRSTAKQETPRNRTFVISSSHSKLFATFRLPRSLIPPSHGASGKLRISCSARSPAAGSTTTVRPLPGFPARRAKSRRRTPALMQGQARRAAAFGPLGFDKQIGRGCRAREPGKAFRLRRDKAAEYRRKAFGRSHGNAPDARMDLLPGSRAQGLRLCQAATRYLCLQAQCDFS